MTLPALIIEGAEVAGPKLAAYSSSIASFFARYKTLPLNAMQRVRQVWQNHPTIGNILATGGTTAAISYMTDEAGKGNKDIISAINESASAAGIPGVDLGGLASSSLNMTTARGRDGASDVIGNMVADIDSKSKGVETDDPAFAQELALKGLMQWAQREISVTPDRLKEFHQNMRLFLSLPTDTLNKAIEVFLK